MQQPAQLMKKDAVLMVNETKKQDSNFSSCLLQWTPRWIGVVGIALVAIWLNFAEPALGSSNFSAVSCAKFGLTANQSVCDRQIVAQVSDTTPILIPKQQVAKEIANTPLQSKFGYFNLFIIFFVTLGPLKVIPVFVQLTEKADQKLRRELSFRSSLISTITIVLVAIIGQNLLNIWRIELPALMIAGGILLFLVALEIVMAQYASASKVEIAEEPSLKEAIAPLAFPTILTPFGIAIALMMMVMARIIGINQGFVLLLLLLVMGLNLVCMLAARPILTFIKPVTLRVSGFVLGVMQLALGIELILSAIEIEVLVIQRLLRF
ncbi:MarC-related protein [Fischerella sp. NIES-4106]|nr:MarC-related protein [Fischerella sp. NIES-4106]